MNCKEIKGDLPEKVKIVLTNIRNRRDYLGYSQEYMAEKLDISQNAYSKIESGKVGMSIKKLFEIGDVLMTTPDKLMQQTQSELPTINWVERQA